MAKRVYVLGVLLAFSAVWTGEGCGGEDDPEEQVEPLDGGPDDVGPMPDVPPFEAGPDACVDTCSEDLHTALDCHGAVKRVCPSSQGCAAGECIRACEAADKAHSSRGCEYYAAVPAQAPGMRGFCYAVAVANTWGEDVSIAIEFEGKTLDTTSIARIPVGAGTAITYEPLPNGKLPSGNVAILFLADPTPPRTPRGCPAGITPAVTDRYLDNPDTAMLDAFRITIDRPVSAHEFFPYGSGSSDGDRAETSSASLLLPTSAWSTNYLAQTPYPHTIVAGPPESVYVQIVAREDDTTVEIQPTAKIVGNPDSGIPGSETDQVQSYALDRGRVLQLIQAEELVGSTIVSTRPIGVWGGSTALSIDVDEYWADWAHQQVLPIAALGRQYAAVRYRSRIDGSNENPPWRIAGVVDDTALTYEPQRPRKAPLTIGRREVATFRFAQDEEPYPFIVRSQDSEHPYYFWAYMTGGLNMDAVGDPEWVGVAPMEQYLKSYLFFTDPSLPETSLVVVRTKEDGSFKDVTLDCAGTLTDWMPLGPSAEYTRLDLVRHAFEPQTYRDGGTCDNGLHAMNSAGPFGVTAWGWGAYRGYFFASYALSTGMSARPLNGVDVPILK